MSGQHAERKHSKYSASGAERWEACPGSVALSEGLPDKSSPWAEEGTEAHEMLEQILRASRSIGAHRVFYPKFTRNRQYSEQQHREMITHGTHAANFVLGMWGARPGSDLLIEERVFLDFIDEEAFGTLDISLVEMFGTLDVFDYKYGAGHPVSPVENLQMIFYALAVAHKYGWNFKRVRMWIIQPRIKGYDGPVFWEIPTRELMKYEDRFRRAIERVKNEPTTYSEGSHCHWCKAKKICPLKVEGRLEKAKSIFTPVGGNNGETIKEAQGFKSEADWRKEARGRRR
ncbi:MAG: DUF2800 domain-containing protein [Nitrospirota bacterium]|nr:DUF2800 domain-containing protein [Nitrospirota bacterium]